jgi:hypothetical protein
MAKGVAAPCLPQQPRAAKAAVQASAQPASLFASFTPVALTATAEAAVACHPTPLISACPATVPHPVLRYRRAITASAWSSCRPACPPRSPARWGPRHRHPRQRGCGDRRASPGFQPGSRDGSPCAQLASRAALILPRAPNPPRGCSCMCSCNLTSIPTGNLAAATLLFLCRLVPRSVYPPDPSNPARGCRSSRACHALCCATCSSSTASARGCRSRAPRSPASSPRPRGQGRRTICSEGEAAGGSRAGARGESSIG